MLMATGSIWILGCAIGDPSQRWRSVFKRMQRGCRCRIASICLCPGCPTQSEGDPRLGAESRSTVRRRPEPNTRWFQTRLQLDGYETISPSGFYHRLTPTLAEYLRDLVKLQGRHEEQAGATLHLLHNATDEMIERIDVTDEKTHDSTLFNTGSWLHRQLVLLDLAYFNYRRFALIDENGGYFVSRLKQNANPVIAEELRAWGGRASPFEGEQIHDVVGDLYRQYIDGEVEAQFKRGQSDGTRSLDTKRFRVVGVRDEDADDYHLYITNLPRDEFLPADLATLYRCRWEVETLFRELKTQYELDEFDTSNPAVVEILVYAALLSLLVSRELLDLVTEQADDEIVFPPECWAATFWSHAQFMLRDP